MFNIYGGQNKYRSGLVKLIRALVKSPMMTSLVSKPKDFTVKIVGFPNCARGAKKKNENFFYGGERYVRLLPLGACT